MKDEQALARLQSREGWLTVSQQTTAFISIGTNVEREKNLLHALAALEGCYPDMICSMVYESDAVGFDGDPFLNLAVGIQTSVGAFAIRDWLRTIEARSGRDRQGPRFSPRTLDMDLLLYGDLVTDEDGLQLPRRELTEHAYVLKPLSEIAADVIHPTLSVTIAELWAVLEPSAPALRAIHFGELGVSAT